MANSQSSANERGRIISGTVFGAVIVGPCLAIPIYGWLPLAISVGAIVSVGAFIKLFAPAEPV